MVVAAAFLAGVFSLTLESSGVYLCLLGRPKDNKSVKFVFQRVKSISLTSLPVLHCKTFGLGLLITNIILVKRALGQNDLDARSGANLRCRLIGSLPTLVTLFRLLHD